MNLAVESWLRDRQVVKTVIAAFVTVAAVAAFIDRQDETVSWIFLGPTAAAFWLWASTSERLAPLVFTAGLSTPLILNLVESDGEFSMFIAVFTAAALASSNVDRWWVRGPLLVFAFLMVLFGATQAISDFDWPKWLLGVIFAWGAGEVIWRFSETVDELELTRSLVSDQAALEERRRIARDVHDLVGHSLTVVLMHVTGARHLVRDDPDEAERALEQAESAGRQSLAEIRRTIGMLRDDADGADPPPPSPDLTDVAALVSEFAGAGLLVSLSTDGPLDRPSPSVALAGYRIIQEALTNASRHTVGAEVIVTVTVGVANDMVDDVCEIVVANRGGDMIDSGHRSGFGLTSMRERARSVGGSLLAGPSTDGWSVEAILPVEPVGIRL